MTGYSCIITWIDLFWKYSTRSTYSDADCARYLVRFVMHVNFSSEHIDARKCKRAPAGNRATIVRTTIASQYLTWAEHFQTSIRDSKMARCSESHLISSSLGRGCIATILRWAFVIRCGVITKHSQTYSKTYQKGVIIKELQESVHRVAEYVRYICAIYLIWQSYINSNIRGFIVISITRQRQIRSY